MSSSQKSRFDKRGKVIVLNTHLLKSKQYLSLSVHARCLMVLMQLHWTKDGSVDYGTREAEEKLNCCRRTAMNAFDQLQDRGFIVCVEQSVFSSRTQSKSRSWRLTWMPYKYADSTHEWEQQESNSTGASDAL